MHKKILVLGGARFHGFLLAEHFASLGNEVSVLNRGKYRTDYPKNIKHLVADRGNTDQLKEILNKEHFDVILDNNAYNSSQIESFLKCMKNRDNHYIFTSTIATYLTHSSEYKLREEEATGIQKGLFSPEVRGYALDKLKAEKYLEENSDSLNYTILRLSNIFGEGDFKRKLLFFHNQLKNNGKIVLERGVTGFNIINVDDLINVFERVVGNENCFGKTMNVAAPRIYNYQEFFSEIYEDFNQNNLLLVPEEKLWDMKYFLPFEWCCMVDTSLSEKLTGKIDYKPIENWIKTSLEWEIKNSKIENKNPENIRMRELELKLINEFKDG